MRNVVVEFGPPGHKGVTAIQGVGADELEPHALSDSVQKAGRASLLVLVGGLLLGSDTLRNIGAGGALASFGASWWSNRK